MPQNKLTLKEIDAEIAKLQQQANEIRNTEKAEVVARVKEAIGYYGLTAADLGLSAGARKGRKAGQQAVAARKPRRNAGRIKFKDGAGNAWTGFGRKPKWFVEALASGKTPEDLKA